MEICGISNALLIGQDQVIRQSVQTIKGVDDFLVQSVVKLQSKFRLIDI